MNTQFLKVGRFYGQRPITLRKDHVKAVTPFYTEQPGVLRDDLFQVEFEYQGRYGTGYAGVSDLEAAGIPTPTVH